MGRAVTRRFVCRVCETPFDHPAYGREPVKGCSPACRRVLRSRPHRLFGTLGRPLCVQCERPFTARKGGRGRVVLFCSRPCWDRFLAECGTGAGVLDWLAVERAKRLAGLAAIRDLEGRLARLKEETWRIDVPKSVLAARRRAARRSAELARDSR